LFMRDFISRRKFIGAAALTLSSATVGAKDGTHIPGRAETSEKIWVEQKKQEKPRGMRLDSATDKLYAVKTKGPFAIPMAFTLGPVTFPSLERLMAKK
jgi:hypothetical protein